MIEDVLIKEKPNQQVKCLHDIGEIYEQTPLTKTRELRYYKKM